jgi:hypothetical protein
MQCLHADLYPDSDPDPEPTSVWIWIQIHNTAFVRDYYDLHEIRIQ